MDQRELAIALESSPSVISALVNNVTGKSAAGKKVRKRALDYLRKRIHGSDSVVAPRSESETPGVEIPGQYRTLTECNQRIKELEADNELLRSMVLAAATHRPLSSTPPISEAQSILEQSGDAHDKRPKK